MLNQRLRNLTTNKLHTCMDDLYKDIETLVGVRGIMTHQLPNALTAMEPWLKSQLPERFFDGQFDRTHTGETPIEPMTDYEQAFFWKRFAELLHPLANLGKQINS